MRSLALSIILLLICTGTLFAALNFPPLTGRVVDEAHILSPATASSLEQKLADYERGTSNQMVVVTLGSLQGASIEEYGYQLGRYWHIGQRGKNNGVLLIVAPQERKVRIEAGYGLEGTLTDAISSEIIQGIILPQFRAGKMENGIIDGTDAILSVLGGKGVPGYEGNAPGQVSILHGILLIALFIGLVWFSIRHPLLAWWLFSNSLRVGGSRIGGGFSGGGGSFGGGGASGGW